VRQHILGAVGNAWLTLATSHHTVSTLFGLLVKFSLSTEVHVWCTHHHHHHHHQQHF